MKTFEYVMSALNMAKTFPPVSLNLSKNVLDLYTKSLTALVNHTQKQCIVNSPNTNGHVSCLFNAFVEANVGKKIKDMNKFGCKNVYSDSGGLQIITQGKAITDELKNQIFNMQCLSDYGFCFDTIPLRSISLVRTKSERSNVYNKVFDDHLIEPSARKTGQDLVQQLQVYKDNNASTRAIMIVQGNTHDDMLLWTKYILEEIPKDLHSFIGGIAVADTCMGNKILETVEMMSAVRRIADEFGEQYTKHVHLLGVGAVERLKPTIYLSKSGYLDCVDKVSYDSSTHTMTPIFGKWHVTGEIGSTPSYKSPESIKNFTIIYQHYKDIFEEFVSEQEFIDIIFSMNNSWNSTSHYKQLDNYSDDKKAMIMTFIFAYCLYQMERMVIDVEKEYVKDVPSTGPISHLLSIKTQKDMDSWLDTYSSWVPSNRIRRNESASTLDDLFS